MPLEKITVETTVSAPPERAFAAFTTPDAITQWNFATDDWCCPSASVDLREGGRYAARMEAKDGSFGFDFAASYTEVDENRAVTLAMDDGRSARTTFTPEGTGTRVATTFDAETENGIEMQRDGWQAILNNFGRYVDGA